MTVNQLCTLIGSPFAADKKQVMQSNIGFWQHQMLLSKLTTPDLVVSASSFSSQMGLKLISVLLQLIAQSFKPFGNQQRPTYALTERPDLFRNRQGLWFLDNVNAVMTLVRGRSSNSGLAKLGHLIHLALFALRSHGYWEYVQRKSNWADDISRLGFDDPWRRCHGFGFHSPYHPTIFFHLPFIAVILNFEFL